MKVLLRVTTVKKDRFISNFHTFLGGGGRVTIVEEDPRSARSASVIFAAVGCHNANMVEIDEGQLFGEELAKLFYACKKQGIEIWVPRQSGHTMNKYDHYATLTALQPVFSAA